MFFKFLLIFSVFGGIYFFWYKNQSISVSSNPYVIKETKEDTSIASFGGSYVEANLVIAATSPNIIDTVVAPTSPVVSSTIKGVSNELDYDVTLNLKNAFSKKYNKDISNVSVFIEIFQESFIKGGVDFDNSGYTATFYAYKSLENTDWEIVAVENGVVACNIIDPYNFPSNIITQCYSYSSGTVVNR